MGEPFNNYSSADLVADYFASGGQLVRYNAVEVKLTWFQTLTILFRYGTWHRTRRDFMSVYPGEPDYEDAVYEATTIYNRGEMERLQKLNPTKK